MATTGKLMEVLFEKTIETYEHQMQMLDLVTVFKPNSGTLQNAGNTIWRPVQQHAPIISGFDLTGLETDIIEETYPAALGTPANDFFKQRVDDLRDQQFWERRGEQSGMRQATELNKALAQMVVNTGSIFYRSNATSGFDFIAEAQATLNERQKLDEMRYYVLNDRDMLKFGKDLASRETLKGRPTDTWATGQIGSGVAGFDVYSGSFVPTITGGAITATTATANVSEAPEGGTVNTATNTVTNVDYRVGTIPVTASAAYAVGDRVQFENTAVPVESIGMADKNASGQPMTFIITAIPGGTSIEVYPKPIALDDAALSVLEKAYANINTQILSGATVVKLNTDASKKANIFWCKNSIEVTGGDAPIGLLNEFGGMKVIDHTMSNGQTMYLAYDGDITTLDFRCRLFTWYGVTNADPSANGIAVTF